MPRMTFTKRSFAGGELSPKICQSRTDLQIYSQGFSSSINLIPFRTGAVSHRPCTEAYPELNLPGDARRLISFYLRDDIHILLVFGHKTLTYITVKGKGAPKFNKTVETPYSNHQAEELDYAISGNVLVLVHGSYPPHQIELRDEGLIFSAMEFSPPPWLGGRISGGAFLDTKMRVIEPENKGTNGAYTVKADAKVFKEQDVGRLLRLGFVPKSWRPRTTYSENSFIYMYGKVYQSTKSGQSGESWQDHDKDAYLTDGGAEWKLVSGVQSLASDGKTGAIKSVGPISPYYVWGRIKEVKGDSQVFVIFNRGVRLQDFDDTPLWNLSAWGSQEGYPSHVSFYQNRLVFSGAPDDASSLHLSEYKKFNSFSPDGEYGSPDYLKALSIEITDDVMREIRWITPVDRGLLIGCDSSLWLLCIGMENGFNIVTRRISGSGVYSCSPIRAGDSLIFVCGAGRNIKSVTGDMEQGFKFEDVTQFVDHLFTFRIKQMVYQEDPYSLLWVIDRSTPIDRSNYNLLGCRVSSEKDKEFAWHAHNVGDPYAIFSLASCFNVYRGETDLWLLVGKRGREHTQIVLEKLGRFHSSLNYSMDGIPDNTPRSL